MLPQFIVLGLMIMSLGMQLARHGEPEKGNHNFWISLLSNAITFWLLSWGGFFRGMF